MAINQQQFDAEFVARKNQLEALQIAVNDAVSQWDRLMTIANPTNESATDLTLASFAARIKTAANNRRTSMINLATAITAIP